MRERVALAGRGPSTLSFEDWWEPYTYGVGPAGAFVGRLDPSTRDRVREACREQLGDGPFTITARAWTTTGVA